MKNRIAIVAVMGMISFATLGARRTIDLSGTGWTVDGEAVSIPHTWNAIDGADGGEPGSGESANAKCYLRKSVVYRRLLPPPSPGKRVFLRFEGVSVAAKVIVDGTEIGRHSGAYTAFVCEATDRLDPRRDNLLEVVVDNYVDRSMPPCAADFTVCGGIYRGVELIETDRACIDPTFHAGPGVWVDADPKTGRIFVDVRLNGASNKAVVHCEVRDPSGNVVAVGKTDALKVEHPALWSPAIPNLYTLTVKMEDGACNDGASVRFGFRSVEFRKDGFYLNGCKYKIHGVNRHQDREGRGWAVLPAEEDEDIDFIKEIGADGLRTAHYPQSGHIYDLCDEKGLLAWVESPNVNLIRDNDAYRSQARTNLIEAIWQLKNHPSIFTWSISNELNTNRVPWGVTERLMTELKMLANETDPMRPVSLATCHAKQRGLHAIPDAVGFNFYPGWYRNVPEGMKGTVDAALADNPDLSTIGVTEYGAGASVTQHGDAQARNMPLSPVHIEEWQAWVHYWNYKSLLDDDRVWGSFVWAMFDFAADARREGPRHGINDKGLMTRDRKFKKDAFHFYKANWNHAPELHLVGARMTETTNAAMTVMGFSNLGNVTLVLNGREVGRQAPDEVKTVVWRKVPLAKGANHIQLFSGGRMAEAYWILKDQN